MLRWLFSLLACTALSAEGPAIHTRVPDPVQPGAKYLIYVHGRILETQGSLRPRSEQHGFYEYQQILEAFRDKGFEVISEARLKDVDPGAYAGVVAGQVAALLKAGVPPQRITVVGASKGGVIAELASSMIRQRRVNFAFLSAGYPESLKRLNALKGNLWGNVLSLYDPTDETGAGSCEPLFAAARGKGLRRTRELQVKLGLGHGILYRPFPEVIDPVAAWASEQAEEGEPRVTRLTGSLLELQRGPWNDVMVFLNTGASLLAIDTGSSPAAAARARAMAEKAFGRKVTHVVNTHAHWDHVFGNQAYAGADIIGHASVPADMRRAYGSREALDRWFREARAIDPSETGQVYVQDVRDEAAGLKLTPPTTLVGKPQVQVVGGLEVVLHPVPGLHTQGFLLVHVPELGLLFAPRELGLGGTPKPEPGFDPAPVLRALDAILATKQPVRWVYMGHGNPLENPDLERLRLRLADRGSR